MSENRRRRPQQPVQPVAAPRKKKKHNKSLKGYLTILAMMAIVATISIGGTLAWLQDSTTEIQNTFTASNIDIDLTETKGSEDKKFKMIPGNEIEKDPKVTIGANSEASWVFVKVTEIDGTYVIPGVDGAADTKGTLAFDDFINYQVLSGKKVAEGDTDTYWNALGTSYPGVYYYKAAATTSAVDLPVIGYEKDGGTVVENKVLVNTSVTKAMMDKLQAAGSEMPKLNFQAFAIQQANFDSAEDAWKELLGN